jgi:acyl-CoA thioester hydrolase
MRHEVRVIFGDTDQMGVVYYANYLRYFESARSAYWRDLGKSYKDLVDAGIALPVIEAHCKYRRSALYEDLLAIEIELAELHAASMRFVYKVWRGGELIADGFTRHAVIGPEGKPRALPRPIRDVIAPTVVAQATPRA